MAIIQRPDQPGVGGKLLGFGTLAGGIIGANPMMTAMGTQMLANQYMGPGAGNAVGQVMSKKPTGQTQALPPALRNELQAPLAGGPGSIEGMSDTDFRNWLKRADVYGKQYDF